MTLTVSAYPALCQKLLAVYAAAFPVTNTATDVYIGDGRGASKTTMQRRILVGVQSLDPSSAPGTAGQGQVVWGPMGNRARDENLTVVSAFLSETGDQDPDGRRTDVFALFGAGVAAVVADPALNRVGGTLYLTGYDWNYLPESNDYGTAGVIESTMSFRARI